ncbi:MAG TPA: transcriptional regulator, partial [bacterium]|nr:transcriptional regulator [bacterium]
MTYLPLSYLLGSRAKVDILRILVSKQNFTGRKIATLSSTNPNSNKKALDFLLETGLISREHVGNAFHYSLNENHLLYEPIVNL